jgi:hypothetical protein
MEHPFDTLSRTLAAQHSRRALLREFGVALAGGLTAWARRGTARSQEGCFDCGETQCCARGVCVDYCPECQTCEDGNCSPKCGPCDDCTVGQCVHNCSSYLNGDCVSKCTKCEYCGDNTCYNGCLACQLCTADGCVEACPACQTCTQAGCVTTCNACQTCVDLVCVDSVICPPCKTCIDGDCISTCSNGCCAGGACVDNCPPCQTCKDGQCVSCKDAGLCCSGTACVAAAGCPNGGCCTDGVCGCPADQECNPTTHTCGPVTLSGTTPPTSAPAPPPCQAFSAVQTIIHPGDRITFTMTGVILDLNSPFTVTVGGTTITPADTLPTTDAAGGISDVNAGPRMHLVLPATLPKGTAEVRVSTANKSGCATITIL